MKVSKLSFYSMKGTTCIWSAIQLTKPYLQNLRAGDGGEQQALCGSSQTLVGFPPSLFMTCYTDTKYIFNNGWKELKSPDAVSSCSNCFTFCQGSSQSAAGSAPKKARVAPALQQVPVPGFNKSTVFVPFFGKLWKTNLFGLACCSCASPRANLSPFPRRWTWRV